MTEPDTGTGTGAGRYAPSPSGDLHVGNLRTAVLAWLFARSTGRRFLLRIEDLDAQRSGPADGQIRDLGSLGITFDREPVYQSQRMRLYRSATDRLRERGLVYECFCTRREIQEAVSAPHAPPGAYPGTCRRLSIQERQRKRRDRQPALRLAAEVDSFEIMDQLNGWYRAEVDDLVLLRADGTPAYNLAVVVDDADQGVDQVVRGDDLLSSTPRQAYLMSLLGLPEPEYVHVPLVVNQSGQRLAKRDGAVTLSDLAANGHSAASVFRRIAESIGYPGCANAVQLLDRWNPQTLPRAPWVFQSEDL